MTIIDITDEFRPLTKRVFYRLTQRARLYHLLRRHPLVQLPLCRYHKQCGQAYHGANSEGKVKPDQPPRSNPELL